jgi:hypothetical protein
VVLHRLVADVIVKKDRLLVDVWNGLAEIQFKFKMTIYVEV